MAKGSKKTVKKAKTAQQIPGIAAIPQMPSQAGPQIPQLSPEKIQKLQRLIAEMILIGSELGMEIAVSDCNDRDDCPIVHKAKEIVKTVKEIREIMKGA